MKYNRSLTLNENTDSLSNVPDEILQKIDEYQTSLCKTNPNTCVACGDMMRQLPTGALKEKQIELCLECDKKTGEEITVTKKVKEKEPLAVKIKKPSRRELEDAELEFRVEMSKCIKKGILTKAMLAKKYSDTGQFDKADLQIKLALDSLKIISIDRDVERALRLVINLLQYKSLYVRGDLSKVIEITPNIHKEIDWFLRDFLKIWGFWL